jgi:hypothetical protein
MEVGLEVGPELLLVAAPLEVLEREGRGAVERLLRRGAGAPAAVR